MRATPLMFLLAGLAVGGGAHASTLRLALGHSARLPVAGPASSVVLGSPSVVDVSVVDSRTVFVSGRTLGSTDVTVIDPLGRIVYRGDIVVAGASGSSVRVFRGAAMTDVACTPYCAAGEGASASAAGPAAGSAPAGATPLGALTTALAPSVAGAAASGASSALGQGLPAPR